MKIASIIDESLEICRERVRDHGVELRIAEAPASAEIDCQSVQIGQVILNLINNACDAVEQLKQPWISVDFRDLGAMIEIAVTDSGSGVPEEARANLFVPFNTTKPVGKGTGLGLSISKQIIESHGGTINLDTACPNTRFVIRLPRFHENEKNQSKMKAS